MDASAVRNAFIVAFSRLFPKTRDVELHVDVTEQQEYLYLDVRLSHPSGTFRVDNLRGIPTKIRIGSRYFRISRKNRQTLSHLADWDPAFDPERGFIFYEKDVPEILLYLRAKGAVQFSEKARKTRVDTQPLQFVHNVDARGDEIQVRTALTDSSHTTYIERPGQGRFPADSKFVHAADGYFRKPPQKRYTTFNPDVGTCTLVGDQIPLFLLHDLNRIRTETIARVDPVVAAQRVVTEPFQPKVSLHVDGPWIWLDVRYEAERFSLPYGEVDDLRPEQQFTRKRDAWIKIDRETHAKVADQIGQVPGVEEIAGIFRTPAQNYSEVQSLLEAVARIDMSEAYAAFLRSLADFSQIQQLPVPDSFRGELRVYQKHGYDWLCFLRKFGLNGILADEMGLGKTVQALVTLLNAQSDQDPGPVLIVCPPSVLSAWKDDISKFTSILDFRIGRYVGPNRGQVLKGVKHYDALMTTYTTVAHDIDVLSRVVWNYVILDEAQKIKNHETATARACKRLIAKHKLALTGTPIENRLSELWSIYDFLMPSYLGPYGRFRDRFEVPIMKYKDRKATEELKKRINPFKLRRLKSQVESELPPKIPLDRYCELKPEQVQLYKEFAAAERDRIGKLPGSTVRIDTSILTAILRLKQICCHPALIKKDFDAIYRRSGKLDAFVEILEELMEGDEKALIFSQFTEMLKILRRVLEDRRIPYLYLDGTTPEKHRAKMKGQFQAGEVPFFLISLRAGGLGMTLTQANCVVHYDRWWNPSVEDQATDRAHRIGQDKPVKVFRIHTVGTIDERISELLVKKKDLFDAVIEVDDLRKEISKEELLSLFAPPAAPSSN